MGKQASKGKSELSLINSEFFISGPCYLLTAIDWCFESLWWIASEIKMKEIRVKKKWIIAENVSFNESVAEVIMDREREKESKIESSKQPKTERGSFE